MCDAIISKTKRFYYKINLKSYKLTLRKTTAGFIRDRLEKASQNEPHLTFVGTTRHKVEIRVVYGRPKLTRGCFSGGFKSLRIERVYH